MLTYALDEIGRAFEAEHQRDLARERKQREQKRQRAVAAEVAYRRLVHDHRCAAVACQVDRWRLAHDLRRYAVEVRSRLPPMPPEGREATEQ